jgi:uncharacterized membrane protein YqaE (UPF0057 family)
VCSAALGVILRTGLCNKDVAINILLTILGYLPGIIHALWIFCTTPTIHRPHCCTYDEDVIV